MKYLKKLYKAILGLPYKGPEDLTEPLTEKAINFYFSPL